MNQAKASSQYPGMGTMFQHLYSSPHSKVPGEDPGFARLLSTDS